MIFRRISSLLLKASCLLFVLFFSEQTALGVPPDPQSFDDQSDFPVPASCWQHRLQNSVEAQKVDYEGRVRTLTATQRRLARVRANPGLLNMSPANTQSWLYQEHHRVMTLTSNAEIFKDSFEFCDRKAQELLEGADAYAYTLIAKESSAWFIDRATNLIKTCIRGDIERKEATVGELTHYCENLWTTHIITDTYSIIKGDCPFNIEDLYRVLNFSDKIDLQDFSAALLTNPPVPHPDSYSHLPGMMASMQSWLFFRENLANYVASTASNDHDFTVYLERVFTAWTNVWQEMSHTEAEQLHHNSAGGEGGEFPIYKIEEALGAMDIHINPLTLRAIYRREPL